MSQPNLPLGKLDFDNLQGERRYGFLSAYFRSKLANIIFSNELARRLERLRRDSQQHEPGTDENAVGDNRPGLPALFPLVMKRLFPGPEVGARTLVYLASSPEMEGISGRFFLRQRARQTRPVTLDRRRCRADSGKSARIWSNCPATFFPAVPQEFPERGMKSVLKLSPWFGRLIVLAVAGLFTMVSLKFILDPQHAAANAGITVAPGLGTTNTRAGFGGFPLGFAVILVFCLFSVAPAAGGASSIATVAAVILAVRLFGAARDATFAQSAHLLISEAAIFVGFPGCAAVEARRRRLPGAA